MALRFGRLTLLAAGAALVGLAAGCRRSPPQRQSSAQLPAGRSATLSAISTPLDLPLRLDEPLPLTRPRDVVSRMSGGQRQAVAIARTRLSEAKLVLMDEPTAAISVRQVEQVLALIRRLKQQGISVVLISHRMPDVFAVSDRVIVMRRGAKVADKAIADTSPEEVTGLITGAIRAA